MCGLTAQALTSMSWCCNNFSSNLPAGIGGMTSLVYSLLYNNNLTGSVPSEIGNMRVRKLWDGGPSCSVAWVDVEGDGLT